MLASSSSSSRVRGGREYNPARFASEPSPTVTSRSIRSRGQFVTPMICAARDAGAAAFQDANEGSTPPPRRAADVFASSAEDFFFAEDFSDFSSPFARCPRTSPVFLLLFLLFSASSSSLPALSFNRHAAASIFLLCPRCFTPNVARRSLSSIAANASPVTPFPHSASPYSAAHDYSEPSNSPRNHLVVSRQPHVATRASETRAGAYESDACPRCA